ncbi:efflux RND transporter permease subunit [Marinomonas mediterranea]|jgi:Cation/multidrug efflux pump|uniref:Acriflavin resistance protein n=1 Tax=Marinomonas mediterranea (strain ATCC 700492 / JCM 21426 / NBRC 103028 / MMB-1) TaxID=717774 RepID=F2K3Z0_MARM1|nr:efflux RND transporter permease subunit [Marinomonas mediterranea]ADZ91332.1 acriflavin resistance protein [Marinomonas mediterranea MMB-1]WCN09302.1 AcrB/AcrD/AcrF family protein [Marinomonas mediterranea]WCN13384.1 AcrB/AcrD/AcrF family protein [Marinomonas mediterranea]WCN17452.1 AcrB/AcrD/AcrF family protein [Marinomonas mediterranea MMB-1]
MQTIIEAALARSRTVLMFFVLILISGTVSYIEIAKESNPDITIPMAYISVSLEGISPEDADSLLVHPLETELRDLEGLKEIKSTASEGHASIILEFETGTDIDQALIDAQNKVDRAKSELPSDADEPTVNEINLSTFPVLRVNLSGNTDFATLSRVANDLKDEIESVQGVLEADISGDRDQRAEIIINQQKLDAYNLVLTDVANLVSNNNRLVAAGTLDTGAGRYPLKVPGLLETKSDILELPIKVDGNDVVRLGDIAEGELTFEDATSYARVDGQRSITLGVSKRVGANIINTIDAVKEVIKKESANWPEGVEYSLSQDESVNIKTSLNDLFNNVLAATLLVMVVILWALGVRSAILVGLAIPGAFLSGILLLNAQGYTINMVVLFALILSVGMLVDGAIVVTEYADRKLAEGASKRQAYAEAAKRMAWPITASTATTLAVFMPLLFWPDIVGEFMRYMPITVIATLSSALVMALIVLPTIGSIIGKKGAYSEKTIETLRLTESGDLSKLKGLTGLYSRMLSRLVNYPIVILSFAIALLIGVFISYGKFGHGVEFFPDIEPEVANLEIRARGDLSLDEKDALVKQVERLVVGHPEIKNLVSTTYSSPKTDGAPDNIGTLSMEFIDWYKRRPASVILDEIRETTRSVPGIEVRSEVQQGGPQSGSDIELQLSSAYTDVLNKAAAEISKKLRAREEIVSVSDDRSLPGIEWRMDVDRAKAAEYGVSVNTLGNVTKLVTTGIVLSDFLPEGADDKIDIVLRYPVEQRSLGQLDELHITSNEGPVPISNFVTRYAAPKQGIVNRVGGKKSITIKADVQDGLVVDQVIQGIRSELVASDLPDTLQFEFRGNTEDQEKSQSFLMKAFGVAFFIMAIILVTQFNNFFQCLLILSAVIFSTMGVLIGLMLKGEPFGIVMSGVGVIALAGVVVNNNIVLIDTFNGLRKQGMRVKEAAVRTGVQRLRPVMLTTITTILGLVPMVFQLNIDLVHQSISVGAPSAQWWTQLSTAIAGGLTFATPLTLILTPCLLVLGYRRAERKQMKALGQI